MALALSSTSSQINKDYTKEECRKSWTRSSHLQTPPNSQLSAEKTATEVSYCELSGSMRRGDKVLVNGSALERKRDRNYLGTVQYMGQTDGNAIGSQNHVGVCLYDNVYSSHNGVYHGKRYFFCPRGHGAMVKSSEVKTLSPVLRTCPLSGNQMFPSYQGVRRRRKLREQMIKDAQDAMFKEHEMRRRAYTERYSVSAKELRVSDQDYFTRDSKKHTQGKDEQSLEELQLQKLKKAFGGDEKAERMIQTLRKLRKAFEEGLAITSEEKELVG